MKRLHAIAFLLLGLAVWLFAGPAFAQIKINEIVEDEQDWESTDITDTREFVELYNDGASAVDIGDWTLGIIDLATGLPNATFTIPTGTMIGPGGYYVIGQAGVPNVNFTPAPSVELLYNLNSIYELRNPNQAGPTTIVDAVGLETFRGTELGFATQEQLDQMKAGEIAGPTAKGGWWGQIESNNEDLGQPTLPNLPLALGRYLDGRDTNVNGRDFGMLPATPGTSNNLAQVSLHDVPNVNNTAVGTVLRNDYYASFKLPRVFDPAALPDAYNPNAIPASPQGGRAIVAWDETGGGNVAYSDEYSNEFKIYAYIDPRPFNNGTANSTQSEATIYGIGTSDIFFGTPNSADLLTGQPGAGGNLTSSANGSTGLGWVIQRRTSNTAGVQTSAAILQLVDMNDGGDGVIADNDWQIIHSIDLTGASAGWHVLGIKYDPTTGNATGIYDDQTHNFATVTGLIGNFYAGYREQLPGANGSGSARPPTYDLFLEGDYNNDGKVDAADYVMWRNNEGQTSAFPNDRFAGSLVGANQYNAWKANFGAVATAAAGATLIAIPEPASMLLVMLGVAAAAVSRRR